MVRSYTALPHEYLEEMQELSDAEYGRLVRALQKYSMFGEMDKLSGNERFFIKRVCNREDRYQTEFAELARKKSEAGKKGAQSRWKGKDGTAIFAAGKESNTHTETQTHTHTQGSSPLAGEDDREAAPALRDLELSAVMREYMNKINSTPSQICIGELTEFARELGAEVCLHAMNVALDEKKTAWSYIRAILRGYRADGVRSLEDVLRREEQREKPPKKGRNQGFQRHDGELSQRAKRAVQQALEEGVSEL